MEGIKRESLDTTFWNRNDYMPSTSDVILRTDSVITSFDFLIFAHQEIIALIFEQLPWPTAPGQNSG
jgi:hypothetical protein